MRAEIIIGGLAALALCALAAGCIQDAVSREIGRLHSSDPAEQASAARALGRLGDDRAYDHLLWALKEPEARVRAAAAEALGDLGNVNAIRPLNRAFKTDKDGPYAASYVRALQRLRALLPPEALP